MELITFFYTGPERDPESVQSHVASDMESNQVQVRQSIYPLALSQRNDNLFQCCESGMIYSGSRNEISEFRIRIQPLLFKHNWKL